MNKLATIKDDYRILPLNDISPVGLATLAGHRMVDDQADDPHAVILRSAEFDIDLYPNLIAIARAGVGVDNIDVEKATARGVPVFYAPGGNADAVADLVFDVIGAYIRNLVPAIRFIDRIDPTRFDDSLNAYIESEKKRFKGTQFLKKTLGVVGMGNVGKRIAQGAIDRGMNVIAFDPLLPDAIWEDFAVVNRAATLIEIMRCCDIVSLHVGLNAETTNLIDSRLLKEVRRKGMILVNYARAEICDEEAVCAAIDSGALGAYLSDFPTSFLLKEMGKTRGPDVFPKIQCTPHLGASTAEAEENCAAMAARQLNSYLRDGTVCNAVNFPDMNGRPHDGCKMRLTVPHRNMPGMLKRITDTIDDAGANIAALHNETKGEVGYCVADLDTPIEEGAIDSIKRYEGILGIRVFRF